jgi:hypothetical protein
MWMPEVYIVYHHEQRRPLEIKILLPRQRL